MLTSLISSLFPAFATPGLSGLGVPGPGGFVGPAEPGVLGAFDNPAALMAADSLEVALDAQLLSLRVDVLLFDVPGVNDGTTQVAPIPSLGVAVPLGSDGEWAFGATLGVPYARFSDQPPDNPTRFAGYSSNVVMLEANVMLARQLGKHLRIGAGLRTAALPGFRNFRAIDTAQLVNDAADVEPPLPVGDPLLEGQLRVGPAFAFGMSAILGATVTFPRNVELHLGFRPPMRVPVRAPLVIEPSNDLNTVIEGQVRLAYPFPAHLNAAARIDAGRFTFVPEAELVGWRYAGRLRTTPDKLELLSTDPLLDATLADAGLANADFIASLAEEEVTDLSWHDILIVGAQVEYRPPSPQPDRWAFRLGFWRAPRVMDTDVTSTGNLDFATYTFRAAASVRPTASIQLVPAFEFVHSPRLVVEDSPSPDGVLPSGNGAYDLDAWRLGLNVVWRRRGGRFAPDAGVSSPRPSTRARGTD